MASKYPKLVILVLCVLLAGLLFLWKPWSGGETASDSAPYRPDIKPASSEGELSIRNFQMAPGLQAELVAAEPMLANPVAFYIDYQKRFYVAETFRLHAGVTDMRRHTDWLVDDMAARTVGDRLAAMRKNLEDFESYNDEHDRIRLIEDADGDGKAERATVFADGFNDYLTGLGAGLLMDRDNLYYTNIPDLWKLQDTDGDGQADIREKLSSGYGVRFGFLGHDLHGLRKGPDGKIYFSIGDRGLNVETKEGTVLAYPDAGAVLRCNLDGSELEIVHIGLRNPQELVFDDYGNLFTGDNNSDGGDQARWVYVVEGGNSGWTVGYQWLTSPVNRGPWNSERLWQPQFKGQAAYIVPPIANIGAGPSGLTYYPGTGLPERYGGHFFLSDFRGSAVNSKIHAFSLQPAGAGFEMVGRHDFITGVLVTDADFGPGAGLYLTDWGEGWDMTGKGRIYRVFEPGLDQDPAVIETARLLREGFSQRSVEILQELLNHPDQRVRLEAQWALADHGPAAKDILLATALDNPSQLARLHAIWGLGQIARSSKAAIPEVAELLKDEDPEVRAQTAKVLGNLSLNQAQGHLAALLKDSNLRVRFFAALSLGEIGAGSAVKPLVEMLRENADRDPYLRHAAVMGLAGAANVQALLPYAGDESPAVKMGVLLALRRLESPEVARFLADPDLSLATEAARAIYDLPIADALPALAEKISDKRFLQVVERSALSEEELKDIQNRQVLLSDSGAIKFVYPLARRVINANFRLGHPENARALVEFAARPKVFALARVEALQRLREWAEPSELDAVVGVWHPVAARDAESARPAILSRLDEILRNGPDQVQAAAAGVAANYHNPEMASLLLGLISDEKESVETRIEALRSAGSIPGDSLGKAVLISRGARNERLRSEGLRLVSRLKPAEAVPILEEALENGATAEQQIALSSLGQIHGAQSEKLLGHWMDRLLQGDIEPEIRLDILEAARAYPSPELQQKIAEYEASLPKDDPLAPYRTALAGGNARNGSGIFFGRAETQCQRCHAVGRRGGGEAGPDLTHLAKRADREYILESIVAPNEKIAPGYENVTLIMKDGTRYAGRVISENDQSLVLEASDAEKDNVWGQPVEEIPHSIVDVVAEGNSGSVPSQPGSGTKHVRVSKSEIETRRRNLSSMPEDVASYLSKFELRDLVEFLAGLD